jgi:hypothetical protein
MGPHASRPSSVADGRLRALPTLLAAGTGLALLVLMIAAPTIASASGWASAGSLTEARLRSHTATLLSGSAAECGTNCGKVLVVGGVGSSGVPLASAELYDPGSNSWTTAAPLTNARADHTANLLGDGTVLVAGGRAASGARMGTAEIYNPATNSWKATSTPMDEPSYDHTATLLSSNPAESGIDDVGKVLVAGGCCNASNGSLFGSELYSPATKSWSATGFGFLNSHRSHTATLLSGSGPAHSRCGMVLVVGGRGGASPVDNNAVTPEIYEPRSQRWVAAGDQQVRRRVHTATLLTDGNVLIAGGTSTSSPALDAAELYDPVTGLFSQTGKLGKARTAHAAARLPDGKVLAAGGLAADGTALTSAELYDFAAKSWSAVPPMLTPRAGAGDSEGPTATLLGNGNVLVVGGTSDRSAEFFFSGAGSGPGGTGTTPGSGGPQPGGPQPGGPQPGSTSPQPGPQRGPGGGAIDALDRAIGAQGRRGRALRSCAGRADRHVRRERSRARRGSARRRARARLHLRRHRTSLRRRCVRRHGRTPGRIGALSARAVSKTKIRLSFRAPGTDGARAPAAHSYLVKQSGRPIRAGRRAFSRAQTLCRGRCRFDVTRVGAKLTLTITGLRPRTTYYYAIAARDNVSGRLGPRARAVRAKTR